MKNNSLKLAKYFKVGKWVYCWVRVVAKRKKKFSTKHFVFSYNEGMIGPNAIRSLMKLELSQTGCTLDCLVPG